MVCANYEFTVGATVAINELAADAPVPAIVGFDNLDLARIIPSEADAGRPAGGPDRRPGSELILERIASTTPLEPRTVVLESELVVGDPATYAFREARR